MNVMVIGSGGREHAIAWKLRQGKGITKLFSAPGNPGISELAECVDIKPDNIAELLKFALERKIDLTVVGPEIPLGLGIVDEFKKAGLKIFGPSKHASLLEVSKIFAKDFMMRHNVPTAKYRTFTTDTKTEALQYLDSINYPVVIKADGLAAGKGVIICEDNGQAVSTLDELFEKKIFGLSGDKIVIEEYLEGQEASVFAICDGENYIVLPPAQDHKKIGNGETGKNTGGMGSFAPAHKVVSGYVLEKIKQQVIEPVLHGMKSEGHPYTGCLYCGLMIDRNDEPNVIEFNARFGDPETQVVLPLVESDLLEMFLAASTSGLKNYRLEISEQFYTCIVLASKGYPDNYETGKQITGLDKITNDCIVFHAGTKVNNGDILSSGGRVLNVVGHSPNSLKESIDIAYRNAAIVDFENKYYRTDIGAKGL